MGEDATMVQLPSGEVVAMLYGSLTTAPAEMVNQEGAAGVYFCFPDVSVRYTGQFRLKANLMRITGRVIQLELLDLAYLLIDQWSASSNCTYGLLRDS